MSGVTRALRRRFCGAAPQMLMPMRRLALAAPLPAMIACSGATAPRDVPVASPSADVAREARADTLAIPVGGTARTQGGKVRVTFEQRLQDSRCPANVVCVWQGDASVRVTIATDSVRLTGELHTAVEPKVQVVDGYQVTLAGLLPYPGSGADRQEPVALLRVARVDGDRR